MVTVASSKVYERVKRLKMKRPMKYMNQMQCPAQDSTVDNIIIMSAIIEKRRTENLNAYIFLQMQLNVLTSYG